MTASTRLALLVVVGASACGCTEKLNPQECEQLLDRYTEKLVLNEQPNADAPEIAHLQEAARQQAHRDPLFSFKQCPYEVSREQFLCAMQAPTVDAMEQCLVL